MSFNRLLYDQETYKRYVEQSAGTLAYMLNPIAFENCDKCRMDGTGIVGGNQVSHNAAALVDTESELRNIARAASRAPERKYIPQCPASTGHDHGLPCGPYILAEKHLKPCAVQATRPRITGPGYEVNFSCPNCTRRTK